MDTRGTVNDHYADRDGSTSTAKSSLPDPKPTQKKPTEYLQKTDEQAKKRESENKKTKKEQVDPDGGDKKKLIVQIAIAVVVLAGIVVAGINFMPSGSSEEEQRREAVIQQLNALNQELTMLPTNSTEPFIEFSGKLRSVQQGQSDTKVDSVYQAVMDETLKKMEEIVLQQIEKPDFNYDATRALVEEAFLLDSSYDIKTAPERINDYSSNAEKLWAYYRACTWMKRADAFNVEPFSVWKCNVMYVLQHYAILVGSKKGEFAKIPDNGMLQKNVTFIQQLTEYECPPIKELRDQNDQKERDKVLRAWEGNPRMFAELDALYKEWQDQNIYRINKGE